ncbi:hypothetical protein B0A48_18069 [Cryoendolithus antarcticus]|uniref:Uncharacterized protein n=1 Tax=Cryoendolithus antarcticus TaxID=1507870 RepID=A0A1V8SAC2_9PEZI|nr:hypothetical protein B0A48_18069 [Cryoendolithus antarcticus]
MKAYALSTSAPAAVVAADKCKLTAYATLGSAVTIADGDIFDSEGFLFQIHDLEIHQKKPTSGNGYPPNYACPGSPSLYGYAHFDDPNKKGVGMCLAHIKDHLVVAAGFDCRGLGGKLFQKYFGQISCPRFALWIDIDGREEKCNRIK